MGLRDEIKAYLDADGLVAYQPTFPGQRNASGNGLLLSSLYFICLQLRGEATMDDRVELIELARRCEALPGTRGLYKRGPVHPDQQAFDDYLGLTTAAYLLAATEITHGVFDYGFHGIRLCWFLRLQWVYNNLRPGSIWKGPWWQLAPNVNAWIGRSPAFVAHLYFCANQPVPDELVLAWVGALALCESKGQEDQDAWLMCWLMVKAMEYRSTTCSVAANRWNGQLLGVWGPQPMRAVVAKCLNPEHPIARHWPELA